eukprot:TRINITY_DN4426_c7_g1_i1.p1 TRINITY_DN4426_c7_g1~~TRINITY_DN4426_c7_g1_i1.p1  ORF type:complete len:620 (+),score=74.16 TRINITY_DN4426_c7_g1_i1:16313-18172(+)
MLTSLASPYVETHQGKVCRGRLEKPLKDWWDNSQCQFKLKMCLKELYDSLNSLNSQEENEAMEEEDHDEKVESEPEIEEHKQVNEKAMNDQIILNDNNAQVENNLAEEMISERCKRRPSQEGKPQIYASEDDYNDYKKEDYPTRNDKSKLQKGTLNESNSKVMTSKELPSDYQLRKALGFTRKFTENSVQTNSARGLPIKNKITIVDILTQEQIRSELQNMVLLEGELNKYKPGISIQYIPRWCQVTRSQFMYFTSQWAANCWLRKPIIILPLKYVKAVERVSVNIDSSKPTRRKKGKQEKGELYQFEIFLKEGIDIHAICQYNEMNVREDQQRSTSQFAAEANEQMGETEPVPGTEHPVDNMVENENDAEEEEKLEEECKEEEEPEIKVEIEGEENAEMAPPAEPSEKEQENEEEQNSVKGQQTSVLEIENVQDKAEPLAPSDDKFKAENAIESPPTAAGREVNQRPIIPEPSKDFGTSRQTSQYRQFERSGEIRTGHLMKSPYSKATSRDRTPERINGGMSRMDNILLRGEIRFQNEREREDYKAFEGVNAFTLKSVKSKEDIAIKNPSAWLPSLASTLSYMQHKTTQINIRGLIEKQSGILQKNGSYLPRTQRKNV